MERFFYSKFEGSVGAVAQVDWFDSRSRTLLLFNIYSLIHATRRKLGNGNVLMGTEYPYTRFPSRFPLRTLLCAGSKVKLIGFQPVFKYLHVFVIIINLDI